MLKLKQLYGTGVALATPFDETGAIDYKGLKKLLSHTARGVDYYVVMGTTGEAATLSREEKKQVLSFVKLNNPKKLPIVFGIGGNNTHEVVHAISETEFEGVDALLSVSPYYSKPPQEGIVQHFHKVADASPVPVILYNVPARTSSNLTASTTLRLAQHNNIIGIKEASGNLEQCMLILKKKPKEFLMISGDDMLTVPIYALGGVGVISVLANALPGSFKKIKEYAAAGSFLKASAEQFKLLEISAAMYEEGNPTGLKQLLSEMNICQSHVRLPLVTASVALKSKIRQLYEAGEF